MEEFFAFTKKKHQIDLADRDSLSHQKMMFYAKGNIESLE